MSAGLAANLAALESGLEGLLSCFESQPFPELAAMDTTWTRVVQAFEEVRRELSSGRARREEHREPFERCQRLYAVATSLLARRREELAAERSACSALRTHLARSRPAGERGGSCDVRA